MKVLKQNFKKFQSKLPMRLSFQLSVAIPNVGKSDNHVTGILICVKKKI